MKKISAMILAGVMILMMFASCGQEKLPPEEKKGGQLKAAMCKVDITPESSVYLEGYGPRDETCFAVKPDNFTTDLIARLLLLEADGKRALYVNLEMVLTGFGVNTSATFQFDLAMALNTTTDNIFLSNTHNHQAMPSLDYYQERAIRKAAEQLVEKLVPVNVGVDSYITAYGISRSPMYNMDQNSPYDGTMTVIRFDNAETGTPVGFIYSAPIHNTGFGVAEANNWKLLNCELCGYASRYIEEKYKDNADFTAMFIDGFYGNSGPYFPEKKSYYATTTAELKGYGEGLAEEVLACYEKIKSQPATDYTIASNIKEETLQRAPITNDIIKYWGDSTTSPLKISAGSFGDIAFIGVNYEPFSTIGARLRAESPYERLIPAGNVGGWSGYIPLKETYHNGRTEVETLPGKTPFDDTAEEQFYGYIFDALCAMKGVSATKILSEKTGAEEKDGTRVYTFEFEKEISPDKLVLSFGQTSRRDCAEDFVLEVLDKKGNQTTVFEVNGNSVNYLGFGTDNIKVKKAILTVKSTYRSETAIDIPAELYAMDFER